MLIIENYYLTNIKSALNGIFNIYYISVSEKPEIIHWVTLVNDTGILWSGTAYSIVQRPSKELSYLGLTLETSDIDR